MLQTRVEHLLKQNKELMDHLQKMVGEGKPKQGVSSPPTASSPPPSDDQNLLHTHVEALLKQTGSSDSGVPGVSSASQTGTTVAQGNLDMFDPLESASTEVTVGAN